MALTELTNKTEDYAEMAKQIYLLHRQSAGVDADVSYKGGVFNINFITGKISQQLIVEGSVKSRLGPTEEDACRQDLQKAHSIAADMHLLILIQTIDDSALKHALHSVTHSKPQARAASVLHDLSQYRHSSFGIFAPKSELNLSVLETVKAVLKESLYTNNTFSEADKTWSKIQSRLTTSPSAHPTQKI